MYPVNFEFVMKLLLQNVIISYVTLLFSYLVITKVCAGRGTPSITERRLQAIINIWKKKNNTTAYKL